MCEFLTIGIQLQNVAYKFLPTVEGVFPYDDVCAKNCSFVIDILAMAVEEKKALNERGKPRRPLKEFVLCCHGNGVTQNKTKKLQFGVSLFMEIRCGEKNFRTFDVVRKVTFLSKQTLKTLNRILSSDQFSNMEIIYIALKHVTG